MIFKVGTYLCMVFLVLLVNHSFSMDEASPEGRNKLHKHIGSSLKEELNSAEIFSSEDRLLTCRVLMTTLGYLIGTSLNERRILQKIEIPLLRFLTIQGISCGTAFIVGDILGRFLSIQLEEKKEKQTE